MNQAMGTPAQVASSEAGKNKSKLEKLERRIEYIEEHLGLGNIIEIEAKERREREQQERIERLKGMHKAQRKHNIEVDRVCTFCGDKLDLMVVMVYGEYDENRHLVLKTEKEKGDAPLRQLRVCANCLQTFDESNIFYSIVRVYEPEEVHPD